MRRAIAPAAAALVAACATSPVTLTQAQLAGGGPPAASALPARAPGPAPRATWPLVRIEPVEDRRADPTALGELSGRQVSSAELGPWLDAELAVLSSPAFTVATGLDDDVQLIVRPRILKAYVEAGPTTKSAALVLEVELDGPGREPRKRTVRGQWGGIKWANAGGEAGLALRGAAQACLDRVRAEIELALADGR